MKVFGINKNGLGLKLSEWERLYVEKMASFGIGVSRNYRGEVREGARRAWRLGEDPESVATVDAYAMRVMGVSSEKSESIG